MPYPMGYTFVCMVHTAKVRHATAGN